MISSSFHVPLKNLQEFEPLLDKNKSVPDLNEKEFDSTIASRGFDSSLFGHPTFSTSPILEPAVNFSPKLSDRNNTKSTVRLTSTVLLAADPFSMPVHQPGLTFALNIPWGSDIINTPNIVSEGTMSSVNNLMNTQNSWMSPLSFTKFCMQ
ncbi:hypothetical protein F8M41_016220 [Gigaspora margarita]|uniref:Uncharacterized protein n=1 Tax=Gigaspora margarita TaxID=4874 RepID=A0A8H4APK4_GIGMA|nr:hypothetical protein F8M41_016220 [Gigaspora margarita]